MATVQLQPSLPQVLFNTVSVGASFNSDIFPGAELYKVFGVQITLANSSSANFTFTIQGSNDGVNFGDFGTSQVISANGSILFNVVDFGFQALRVKAVRTGGSGDFKITATGKQ